jgi:DNA-binding NarL/FixJ family response regulator
LLLIAQSPVWRYALQTVVQMDSPKIDVETADHSLAAYSVAPRFNPDLTIIQDALPGVSGMIAARMIRQIAPSSRVIVLADDVQLAIDVAGKAQSIDAVLPSASEPDDLNAAIRSFPPRVESSGGSFEATPLEIALLDGVSRGLSLEAIAAATGSSTDDLTRGLTVLHHMFGSAEPTTLVANAIRRGWIDLHVRVPGVNRPVSFAVAA